MKEQVVVQQTSRYNTPPSNASKNRSKSQGCVKAEAQTTKHNQEYSMITGITHSTKRLARSRVIRRDVRVTQPLDIEMEEMDKQDDDLISSHSSQDGQKRQRKSASKEKSQGSKNSTGSTNATSGGPTNSGK